MEEFNYQSTEHTFLCFEAAGVPYIVPLAHVVRIAASPPPELPVFALCDKPDALAVVVWDDDIPFAVTAEHVEGLTSIAPADQFELPSAVQCRANAFLGGVCRRGNARTLAFLFDCHGALHMLCPQEDHV